MKHYQSTRPQHFATNPAKWGLLHIVAEILAMMAAKTSGHVQGSLQATTKNDTTADKLRLEKAGTMFENLGDVDA